MCSDSTRFAGLFLRKTICVGARGPVRAGPETPVVAGTVSRPRTLTDGKVLEKTVETPVRTPTLGVRITWTQSFFKGCSTMALVTTKGLPTSPDTGVRHTAGGRCVLVITDAAAASPMTTVDSTTLYVPACSSIVVPRGT